MKILLNLNIIVAFSCEKFTKVKTKNGKVLAGMIKKNCT